ncbi:MAG: hypothetical protein ACI8RD_013225, partial [Bacillariaceae sp.]
DGGDDVDEGVTSAWIGLGVKTLTKHATTSTTPIAITDGNL